jgi:hypothetical protein
VSVTLTSARTCARDGCGNTFTARRSDARYCSDSCRAAASRNRTERRTDSRPDRIAAGTAIEPHALLTWQPATEPRGAWEVNEACPECDGPLHTAGRATRRACLACEHSVVPPGVTAPHDRGGQDVRQVRSQRERDLAAITLSRRKGIMLVQLAELTADDRLHPESRPVVGWFADEVRDAATGARLDELAALVPDAGIRRVRWWQGNPPALEAEPYDGEDDGEGHAGDGDYEDDYADDQGITAPPRATSGQLARENFALARARPSSAARALTWPDAITACGWRLSPTVGGCQIVEYSARCGAGTAQYVASVTGAGGWVCSRHYAALCQVIQQ